MSCASSSSSVQWPGSVVLEAGDVVVLPVVGGDVVVLPVVGGAVVAGPPVVPVPEDRVVGDAPGVEEQAAPAMARHEQTRIATLDANPRRRLLSTASP